MKKTGNPQHPLLVEWSPTHVRTVDPGTLQSTNGVNLAEAAGQYSGREAIIAVSQRSAFIRSLFVPPASRSEIAKILEIQLGQLLPLDPKEYVFGFRLGAEVSGKGRLAVIGAVKADSLHRIYSEAAACGLRVRAVVPLAFGSWLAARAGSQSDCAVVEMHNEALNVDIIQNGELFYSRSIPAPESLEEIDDEIGRTFAIAEVAPGRVLAAGSPAIKADLTDDKETIEYLADYSAIEKLIFSIDLPESKEVQTAAATRRSAQRAIGAAIVALALGGYAIYKNLPAPSNVAAQDSSTKGALKLAKDEQASLQTRAAGLEKSNKILDVAFNPGQSIGDMVEVLANSASPKSWFTSMTLGRGIPISISGRAMSDADVAKFVSGISKDPRFREMKVESTTKAVVAKRPVTQFLISGKPVGALAFDRPPKAEKHT